MTKIKEKDFAISTSEARVVSIVKDTLNIGLAARALGVPKTTLASVLSKLEKKLGKSIFIRKQGSGQVIVTDFGTEVIPKLEKLLWMGDSLRPHEKSVSLAHNIGDVAIISSQTLLEGFVCPYISDFLDDNPRLKMRLLQKDDFFHQKPSFNDIFIGLWEDNLENYQYIPYHVFSQRLWASQKYLDQAPPLRCIEDLVHHRLLVSRDPNAKGESHFLSNLLGIPLSSLNIFYTDSTRLLDVMAQEGFGLMFCSEETNLINHIHLKPVLPDLKIGDICVFVKIEKNFLESSLAQFVVDWLFECKDQALKSINKEPFYRHDPLFQLKNPHNFPA